jgi:hypothetical protein
MARRLLPALIAVLAALAGPAGAGAAEIHAHAGRASDPRTGKEALRLARQIQDGKGVSTGRELSPVLRTLAERLPELRGADRRRAERLLARPTNVQEANPSESTYAVPEATPYCGAHFCVHYVTTTKAGPPKADQCRNPADDRPDLTDANGNGVPDYVESMLDQFEYVYGVENGQLGWRAPKPDFGRGGDDRTDVYVKNIGPEGIFGYSAPDARQPLSPGRHQLAAYLVMDNDYCQAEYRNQTDTLKPLQVTAAHEYNHVLQFNYDAQEDNWMFESTAVWMEDKVYDDLNDWVNFLPQWSKLTLTPLTQFNSQDGSDAENVKVYGDGVWNRWIDERLGPDTIRRAWEQSVAAKSFAPGAYDRALRERGTSFFNAFTKFTTDTAEWRAPNGLFEEGNTFPDVQRALNGDPLQPQTATHERSDFVEGTINHASYALFNVDPSGEDDLKLAGKFRRGVPGAIALVGRTGDETGAGTTVVRIKRLPHGGSGRVSLSNATTYSRVTGVLINADTAVSGYSQDLGDWVWLGDDEPIALAINDFTKPRPVRFAPRPGAHRVSPRARVTITFSEGVTGISTSSVRLIAPGGRSVHGRLSQNKLGTIVRIRPSRPLTPGARYTVKLSSDVTDGGGHALPSARRTWRFTTGR